jgi:PilZ domain-containing protein
MDSCRVKMANEIPTRRARTPGAHGQALLQGIKREDWRARPEAALRLGRELAGRDEIVYWVVSPGRQEVNRDDRRRDPRRRARLRSVKLLDGAYRFLCEGSIRDRSPEGFCLALARDIALPHKLAVHIDETAQVRDAKVIWRRGSTVGIRVGEAAPADALRPSDSYALKERYYAIPG